MSQRWFLLGMTVLLLLGAILMLSPFSTAIGWAIILAVVSWPAYQRVERWFHKQPLPSALTMTLLVTLGVLIPVGLIANLLIGEVGSLYPLLQSGKAPAQLTEAAGRLPTIGPILQKNLEQLDISQLQQRLIGWLPALGQTGQQIGRGLITFGLTIVTLYFCYYHGEFLALHLNRGLNRLGGATLQHLLQPLTLTLKGVVLGIVLTAVVQGCLAGLAFGSAGVPGWTVWAVLVTGISLLQIPTLVVWLPCALWLGVTGQGIAMILVILWGQIVIVSVGNILKAALISQGTGLPFYLMFCSVLGGVLAFGTVGIVVGPLTIALLKELWQVWEKSAATT